MSKVIIFSAPSGAGKTTIGRSTFKKIPELVFSISATTRERRGVEMLKRIWEYNHSRVKRGTVLLVGAKGGENDVLTAIGRA